MSYGQSWTDQAAGDGFAAPLDLNFSFDPSLMEALPDQFDTIPDFFLVAPRDIASDPSGQLQQPQQHFQALSLDPPQQQQPPPPPPASGLIPTNAGTSSSGNVDQSHASTPSDGSPHVGEASASGRSGAGRNAGNNRRPEEEDVDTVLKRQRNTIAARKYRQKRLDRIKELEDALEDMTKDRDDLRLKLARQEAETAALKEMMRMSSGQQQGSSSKN